MERSSKQYNVQLDDEEVVRLDRMAESLKLNRSQLMRNLITTGLDDLEMLQDTGVFKAVEFSREFIVKVKEAAVKGKIALDKKGDLKLTK